MRSTAACRTSAESAAAKPLVIDRVAAGVLSDQMLSRSFGVKLLASAWMIWRACISGLPAWLAEVSTRMRRSRDRAGDSIAFGRTCQAKSVSPFRSW